MSTRRRSREDLLREVTSTVAMAPEWVAVFQAVDRAHYVPDEVWTRTTGRTGLGRLEPLSRATDPERWHDLVYTDDALVTQVDDGRPAGPGGTGRQSSSSASQPSVVAAMLMAAQLSPGQRVLEIGTGTGYNAALMVHVLGPGSVITIEIDPEVARRARDALKRAGIGVTTVLGDGTRGHADGAPYDRLLSTCAVQRVPLDWITQTRPGGRIVTPWATPFHNGGLLALTVEEPGRAVGSLIDAVTFMWERGQRRAPAAVRDLVGDDQAGRPGTTHLDPVHIVRHRDAAVAIGLAVPDCTPVVSPAADGTGEVTVWFLDRRSGSWASVDRTPGLEGSSILEHGPRDLWQEVATAYDDWVRRGRRKAGDRRFTVSSQGQHVT